MPQNTRLAGHELAYEGAPHNAKGHRIGSWAQGSSGTGKGKCSCGVLSPVLDSAYQRKAWHKEHKEEIRRILDQPIEEQTIEGWIAQAKRDIDVALASLPTTYGVARRSLRHAQKAVEMIEQVQDHDRREIMERIVRGDR